MNAGDPANPDPDYARISLMARLAVALLAFEDYAWKVGLHHPAVVEMIEYLWELPTVPTPDEFVKWEERQPVLVGVGLGDPLPESVADAVRRCGIVESEFERLLRDLVEIPWGSFYCALADAGSLRHLHQLLTILGEAGIVPTGAQRFAPTVFWWGPTLTSRQRDEWRYGGPYAYLGCAHVMTGYRDLLELGAHRPRG